MVVHKYNLRAADLQQLSMPKHAKILSVQLQRGELVLWAFVDISNEPELRTIELITTGNSVYDDYKRVFIDTVQLHSDNLVYHFFEIMEIE